MWTIALSLALAACLFGLAALAILCLRLRRQCADDEENRQTFTTLADMAPAGIWRTDDKGRCIYVNRAWEETAGITDWEGDGWAAALHPDDHERVVKGLMTSVAREEKVDMEWRWLRPDGSSIWVKGIGAPEYDEDGEVIGYVGINFDIQRSKDLEEDLQAARRKAVHQARAKSTFLANMSHEIRTPMNGVIGFTELLLESDLDEDQRAQAQLIADSGRAMMQLLNDVLDHAKIESGQLEIRPEPIDLRHKLKHVVKLMEPMARAKGLSLGVWLDDDVPELIEMDRLRLRQVLLNLVGNAIKFTETGGIDVEARVENSNEGRTLLISVIDTGIGIHEEKLEDIFTPFKQEDGSTARRFGGTGLGLSISSHLVAMMGGRISVHSKQDVGTQFILRLPLRLADRPESPAADERPAREEAISSLAGTRLLIAEDHAINQELVMAMAESLGLDAQLAADGEEAIEAVCAAQAEGRPFAAVLMDMQMPGMDGLEATRRLRAQGFAAGTLPIIALTANCYAEDVAACKEAGMQSHLGKPVTTLALARELARRIAGDKASAPANGRESSHKSAGETSAHAVPLKDRYRARRTQLVSLLRQSLSREPLQTDWGELARQLHQMAGVAANFGEPELGAASRRLERQFKIEGEPAALLRALEKEMPIFEQAA